MLKDVQNIWLVSVIFSDCNFVFKLKAISIVINKKSEFKLSIGANAKFIFRLKKSLDILQIEKIKGT
jgi:hypothetical protein